MADLQDFAAILPSGKWKMEISMNWHHISASSGKLPPNPLFSRIHVGLHKGSCKPAAQRFPGARTCRKGSWHTWKRSHVQWHYGLGNCQKLRHVIGISDGRMEPMIIPIISPSYPTIIPINDGDIIDFYHVNHGLVGNFHIIGTIEMGCLIPIGSMYAIYGNMDPINIPPLC